MSPHLKTVEAIYAAFGRGEIETIIGHLSPDVAWEAWADNSAQRAAVPWMKLRHGHVGARDFFAALGVLQIHSFEVLSMMGNERQVAVEFTVDATVTASDERFRDEEMHLWSFDVNGRVCRFRHYLDTAKHVALARALARPLTAS